VSHKSRWEYLRRIHRRYAEADRFGKSRILDEFCEVAGFHRKYALRLLNGPPPGDFPERRRRRAARYSAAMVSALEAIWVAAGCPWSVRLKALLPTWLPWARRRFRLTPHVQRQLLQISPRQIDRRLKNRKHRLKRRLYGRTKPGTLLKHHIPLKTDRWDVTSPGFTEIDLVAHSGDSGDGTFLHSLNLTDIHTAWVETRALWGKGQIEVQKALADMRAALPFLLKGIDADNGSEFINLHLYRYCQSHAIQFTRGRPYKKDDNAHIEQKNWTHVRKLVGYARYDSPEALRALNALYVQDLRLLQNLFLPSVKLVRKERVGSHIRRRYDCPQTPFERVLACPEADPRVCTRLRLLRDRLDPFELSRRIDQQIEHIQSLASRIRIPQSPRRHGPGIRIHPETGLGALRRAGAPL
jgi:hypothetical protein